MWRCRTGLTVLTALVLGCAAAWADDGRKAPPEDPDPGFLEFLGSVDRLADLNPDYLAQAGTTPPPARSAVPAAPARPPPPPQSSPPPPLNTPGHNSE